MGCSITMQRGDNRGITADRARETPRAPCDNCRESLGCTVKLGSRNKAWSATTAPADHASSMGFARRRKRPETEQAARWSPKSSRTAPHPSHLRLESSNGRRVRRRRLIWKSTGESVVAGDVGTMVSYAAAWGPELERSVARDALDMFGIRWCSR